VVDLFKFIIVFIIGMRYKNVFELINLLFNYNKIHELKYYIIPSLLYSISNNLIFYALFNLNPINYVTSYNLQMIIQFIFSVFNKSKKSA